VTYRADWDVDDPPLPPVAPYVPPAPPETPREKRATWAARALVWLIGLPFMWGFIQNLLETASWWSLIAIVGASVSLWTGAMLVPKWPITAELLFGAGQGLLWFHWSYRTKQLADFSFQSAGPVMRWVKAGTEAGIRTAVELMMVAAPLFVLLWIRGGEVVMQQRVLESMRRRH
jgi:hypothetical protein